MFGHNDDNQQTDNHTTDAMDDIANEPAHSAPSTTFLPTPGSDSPQDISGANPVADSGTTPPAHASVNDDELLDIKRTALEELAPLVDHLEQSPEEKFKTTMMMIQATDDAGLVKEAYDIAKKIADEKVRAQALLDIVNEINYFTQPSNSQHQS